MVSRLLPVNIKMNNFYDGQQVTRDDLNTEQTRNVDIDAALENNFFGSGVIPEFATAPVIFDSYDMTTAQQALFDAYSFDGSDIYAGTPAVSDLIKGVQLSVTLTDVRLDGAFKTYISIIGDTFGGDLIHDDLTFNNNGTQVTRGRYKTIRSIIFDNFAGNLNGSLGLALIEDGYSFLGRCEIKEATAMEVSADPLIAHQTSQPSLFFQNFHPASASITLTEMFQSAIGSDKSIAELDIGLSSVTQRELVANDVTTRIGQKFLSTGNNIQKISVLLSVKYDSTLAAIPGNDGYEWTGSVVLTLHELLADVLCPVSPVPDDAIDFDPNPTIVAQLTLDADDLAKQGVDLDGYAQIVDFVFTGSKISDPLRSTIEEDKYYVLSVGRSGNADIGTILIEEASDRLDNSYMVVYDGEQWINVYESDMWFAVYGDYVKIADGIAYDNGIGVQVPRIAKDSTNTEVAYVEGFVPFYDVDSYNYVLLETTNSYSDVEQDQRTGNPVYSRVTPSPVFSLENLANITTLLTTDPDPVILARVRDYNPRGNPSEISGESCFIGLAYGNRFDIINPDADVIQNNWVGSILYPADNGCASCNYRIIKQTLYNDSYGDINGDGVVDASDLTIIASWVNTYTSIDITNAADQLLFTTGTLDIRQFLRADVNGDGIVDVTDANLIQSFVNKSIFTFPAGDSFSRTELVVENLLNPETTEADLPADCCSVFNSPFTSCVDWRIEYFATWIPDAILYEDFIKYLPTTFSNVSTTSQGGNTTYIPGDVIIVGNIITPTGSSYPVGIEVNHISLEIPITDAYGNAVFLDGYAGLLLFDNFVAEYAAGKTESDFPAMKYTDGTYVQISDFAAGRVKIAPAIQSLANEYQVTFGGSVKDLVGLYYDPITSLMTLYMDNLYNDGSGQPNAIPSLSTKILITIYLKKAGFVNATSRVTKAQMLSLLGY